jgi:hypothetical protein
MTEEELLQAVKARFVQDVANGLLALMDERDGLRAENARLREALEEINKRDSYPPDGYGVWAEIARKALEVKP